MTNIKSFLFYKNDYLVDLVKDFNEFTALLILPIFSLGVLFVISGKDSLNELFLRLFFAFFLLAFGKEVLMPTIDFSFDFTDKILRDSSSYRNFFYWQKRVEKEQLKLTKSDPIKSKSDDAFSSKGLKSWITSAGDKLSNLALETSTKVFTYVLWLFSFLCISVLRVLYSYVYHVFFILLGFGAVLSIVPVLRPILTGVFKTYLWLLITPFFTGITILIMSNELFSVTLSSSGGDYSLLHWSRFMFASIMILFTPVVSSMFISGAGAHAISSGIAQSIATSTLMSSHNFIMQKLTNSVSSPANKIYKAQKSNVLTKFQGAKNYLNGARDVPNFSNDGNGYSVSKMKSESPSKYNSTMGLVKELHSGNYDLSRYPSEVKHGAMNMIHNRDNIKGVPSNFNLASYNDLKSDIGR